MYCQTIHDFTPGTELPGLEPGRIIPVRAGPEGPPPRKGRRRALRGEPSVAPRGPGPRGRRGRGVARRRPAGTPALPLRRRVGGAGAEVGRRLRAREGRRGPPPRRGDGLRPRARRVLPGAVADAVPGDPAVAEGAARGVRGARPARRGERRPPRRPGQGAPPNPAGARGRPETEPGRGAGRTHRGRTPRRRARGGGVLARRPRHRMRRPRRPRRPRRRLPPEPRRAGAYRARVRGGGVGPDVRPRHAAVDGHAPARPPPADDGDARHAEEPRAGARGPRRPAGRRTTSRRSRGTPTPPGRTTASRSSSRFSTAARPPRRSSTTPAPSPSPSTTPRGWPRSSPAPRTSSASTTRR